MEENKDKKINEETDEVIGELLNIKAKAEYSDEDIQVLDGLEAVRKRPGMYIGTTSARGLHHLVWEIVDNGIDEAMAGYASQIQVSVDQNNIVTVEDDGRGMPTGLNSKTGKVQLKQFLPFCMPAVNSAGERIRFPAVCMVLELPLSMP